MLNTFLIRHDAGHIQALDDLQIHEENNAPRTYRIGETAPAFTTRHMLKVHEAVREVTPRFRMELQRLDDEIEALTRQREDTLSVAFDEGMTISVDDLESYID